jgi:homoserine kinase
MDSVTAFAPATVANLGPGFDVLGLALGAPGDTVTARRVGTPGVRIVAVHGDGGVLPLETDRNTAGIAAVETLRRAGVEGIGVELTVHKGLPIGSGLGSSAASAAAAACAVNILVGSPLRKSDLVGPCIEAEAAVSGRHADNVAPALLGGLILVRCVTPLDIVRVPLPDGLAITVVTPAFELATKAARAVLPTQVPLEDLVRNTANIGALISACHSGDLGLLGRCVTDRVVAAARAALVPGAPEVIAAALDKGALGASISGAGPSVFALCRSPRSARESSLAMIAAFAKAGLAATSTISDVDCPGARQI